MTDPAQSPRPDAAPADPPPARLPYAVGTDRWLRLIQETWRKRAVETRVAVTRNGKDGPCPGSDLGGVAW